MTYNSKFCVIQSNRNSPGAWLIRDMKLQPLRVRQPHIYCRGDRSQRSACICCMGKGTLFFPQNKSGIRILPLDYFTESLYSCLFKEKKVPIQPTDSVQEGHTRKVKDKIASMTIAAMPFRATAFSCCSCTEHRGQEG